MTKSSRHNIKNLPTCYPAAINFHSYFSNNNPIDLEIGCGRPHFFFDRAKNFPNRNIIGIEWKYEFVKQAQKRIMRENINNACALHGNAWLLVPLLFKKNSLNNIFINFPDPWWKDRHKKRLLLNHDFLDILLKLCKTQSKLIIQTDVSNLLEYYKNIIKKHKKFLWDQNLTQEIISQDLCAQTHREKKCLEDQLPIYRAAFKPKQK